MIETQIVRENKKPRFVVMDYELYEKFYDLIEQIEDKQDSRLDPRELGPRIPFAVVESISDGKSPTMAWREYRGYTQSELAKKLKLTQAAISSMENPTSNPRLSTLKKVAKALHCPVESLLPSS